MKIQDIYEEPGFTYVAIKHRGRIFSGTASLAEEDKKNASKVFGGRLAETRAERAVIKYELEKKRKEFYTVQNFLKACLCTKKFDVDSDTAKVLFHQYNIIKKDFEALKAQYKDIRQGITRMINERDKYVKKLQEKRAKADKE